jgi:Arc/MetJ-type ribon-helix-helix transcriptional regulator
MPGIEKRTISLPAAQASYIDALVEAGTYASASEVVRAGLRAAGTRRSGRAMAARGGGAGLRRDTGGPWAVFLPTRSRRRWPRTTRCD